MYLGRIVELAATRDLYTRPAHPYTQALLAAVPTPDPRSRAYPTLRLRVVGRAAESGPTPAARRCAFHERCPRATARCRTELPPLGGTIGTRPQGRVFSPGAERYMSPLIILKDRDFAADVAKAVAPNR